LGMVVLLITVKSFYFQNVVLQKTIDRWFVSNILIMYFSHRPSIPIICNYPKYIW